MIHLIKWIAVGIGIFCSLPLIAFGVVCSIVAWDAKYFDNINGCLFDIIADID